MTADLTRAEQAVLAAVDQRLSETVRLVQELVRIPSETGCEAACQAWVASRLREMGLEVDVFSPEEVPGLSQHPKWIAGDYSTRPNVVGRSAGSGGGRSLLLMAHVDTVLTGPPDLWRFGGPYSGASVGGRIYGRGTTDDKGELAGMIAALEAIRAAGVRLQGDVWLCSVIDEESGGGIGSLACALRRYPAEAAIYCDGLDMKLQVANLGNSRCQILFQNSVPGPTVERTVMQVDTIYQAILRWRDERAKLFAQHPLYRDTEWPGLAAWVAEFRAGDAAGIDLGHGRLKVYVFALPSEHLDVVRADFEQQVWAAARAAGLNQADVRIEWQGQDIEPSQIDREEPIVSCLVGAFEAATRQPAVIGGQPGCDAYVLNLYANLPTVSYGFGVWGVSEGAHQVDESVSIDEQLLPFARSLALSILRWCGEYQATEGG